VHADVYGGLAAKLRSARLVSTKHNDDPFRAGSFRFVERGLSRLHAQFGARAEVRLLAEAASNVLARAGAEWAGADSAA
jgi:hypothetical protein